MPTQTFDETEREAYARYPETLDADALARCFHLDERDRALIASLRGDHNRVGFAAQLGTVRLLGVLPGEDTAVPAVAVTALARQIGVRVPDLAPYWAGRQRWRHAGLIRSAYGYRDFDAAPDARFRLTRWLYALCWTGDDRPGLLLERTLGWLLGAKILLPGPTTVERLCARVRGRVQTRRWKALADAFSPEQRARLDALLAPDADPGLEALRQIPQRFTVTEFTRLLERLDAVRTLGLAPETAPSVPAAVIDRLARSARRTRSTQIARLPEPRRTAMLAALFHAIEGIALDDALDLFDQLVEQDVRDARRRYEADRLRSLGDLDAAALLTARTAKPLVAETASEEARRKRLAAALLPMRPLI